MPPLRSLVEQSNQLAPEEIKQLNILLYNDVPRDLRKLGSDVQYEYVYNEY